MTGKYICLEGVDYSGKTTTLHLLHDYLLEKGINSTITKHPGATWIGQKIRKIVKSEDAHVLDHTRAMLFAVDNAAFQEEIAKPMMDSDDWLIADRNNFTSALAYQIADGVSLDEVMQIHSSLLNPRKIDEVFILDISYDTRMKRKLHREAIEGEMKDYYERDREHFDKLRRAYLRLSEMKDALHRYVEHNDDYALNIHVIDANVPGEEILEQIVDKLKLA